MYATVIHQQLGDEPFVVALNLVVLKRGLKECVENMEAGLVGRKPRASFLHSSKRTNGDVTVGFAAPGASPMLKTQKLLRSFSDKGFYGILIAKPIASRDRVITMLIERVVWLGHSGRATFSGNSMAAHRIDLRDYGDAQTWICFSDGDRCAKSCAATTNEQDVVGRGVHGASTNRAKSQHSGVPDAGVILFSGPECRA